MKTLRIQRFSFEEINRKETQHFYFKKRKEKKNLASAKREQNI